MDEQISLNEALKSLSLPNFGPHAVVEDHLVIIKFKTNQNFDNELNEKSFSHFFGNDKSAIILFQSEDVKFANKIFWRLRENNFFNHLDILKDSCGTVTKYCFNFLLERIRNGENGILKSSEGKKIYEVHDIGNKDDHNLLIDAVIQNNADIIFKLLQYDFDLDLEFQIDKNMYSAIDKAWEAFVNSNDKFQKNICSQIVVSLLKANSKFPTEFNYDIASYEIMDFIADCEELRDYVDSDDIETLGEKIRSSPDMTFFYDEDNESIMLYALKHKKRKIYDFLASLDLNIGCHEIYYLKDIYKEFEERQRRALYNRNQTNAKHFPKTHLLILKSKSKIGNNDRESRQHWRCINEAYDIIDQHESGSKILQIAATHKSLKIFFDFKHNSTYYFNPYSSASSLGIIHKSGIINIGARDLLKENKKYEVIGVIAHEFCHLSMLMIYMNNFDPYKMGNYDDKTRFVDKVVVECERNQDCENLVGNVFNLYPKDQQHSELIVLVIQMMMLYFIKDSKVECDNSKIIAERIKTFPELFNYFKDVVEPEMEKALPILKKLQDDKSIKFEELTQSMKAKVLHSLIKFQGIETTLFEVIGDDEEILSLLSSEDLKDILLNREYFFFGDVCRMSAKYGYIERKFMKFKNGTKTYKFEDMKKLLDTSKVLLLTGKAGSGKTTTFENLSKRLKSLHKNYWISFIRLRNFREIFEEFSKLNINPNLEEVFKLLCKVLFAQARMKNFNFDGDFEVRIFKKLFYNNQVIFLFDGIDEICPRFNIFIANILKLLKDESKIQFWISTRPQHVEQFEEKFNIESYMLEPYSRLDQRKIITEIFNKSNDTKDKNFDLLYINVSKMFKKYQDFNNPLIIVIITEIYISGKIDFEITFINLYDIYEKLIDAQVEKVESKIDSKERSIFLNFKLLFQVLAIKFLFEHKDIKNLSIIKRWKKEKINWTAEKIQRFGFVIVDLTFLETDDRNSIDFIHKTFAEFFAVQFIIEAVFNDDEDIRKEEIDSIVKFIELLKSGNNDSFLLSFFENKSNIKGKRLQNSIKELICKQIENNIARSYFDSKTLLFWSQFLHNDPTTLKEAWKGTGDRSLYRNIYFHRKSADYDANSTLTQFLCNCFGDNWEKNLVKKNLDHLNQYVQWGRMEKKMYDKNFFKLLYFMEENFSRKEKKLFWRDFFCYFQELNRKDIPADALFELFNEVYKMYPKEEGILLHIIKKFLCKHFTTIHINNFMKCLELAVDNDHEKIQKVLFSKTVSKNFMTNLSDEYNNDFILITSLYIKYKESWEDVQKVFIKYGNFYKIFEIMKDSMMQEFMEQLKIIFDSNAENFIQFISASNIPFDGNVFAEIENFLIKISNGDENFRIQVMRSILFKSRGFNDYINKLSTRRIQNFPQIIAFYKKYQTCFEEVSEIFKSWSMLSEMILHMSNQDYSELKDFIVEIFASNKKEIIACIQKSSINHNFFFVKNNIELLEKFAINYFNDNQADAKEFIKAILLFSMHEETEYEDNFFVYFLFAFNSERHDSLVRIRAIISKYLTVDEFKEQFLARNVYCKAFRHGHLHLQEEFSKFIIEIFGHNLSQLIDTTFNPEHYINLVSHEEYFNNFVSFTSELFGNESDSYVKIFVKKMFFDPENFQIILNYLVKTFQILVFQNFLKILINYKDDWKELQEIFIYRKQFLKIFVKILNDYYPEFEKFIIQVFECNKLRLLDSINFNEGYLLFEEVDNLKLFEDFLAKFFENDENCKIECLRKILFADYSIEQFPLLILAKLKDPERFKILKNLYTVYKISWNQLQVYFASKPISSLIFSQMTEQSYLLLKEFIVEIYGTDKSLLRESYESLELLGTNGPKDELFSSDIDYTEDVNGYYIDLENMESFRIDFEKFVYGSS